MAGTGNANGKIWIIQNTKPNLTILFECSILVICIIDLFDAAMKSPLQDDVGVGISLQNRLAALRETERGLLAYNCYVKCAKSELSLTLPTIMVNYWLINAMLPILILPACPHSNDIDLSSGDCWLHMKSQMLMSEQFKRRCLSLLSKEFPRHNSILWRLRLQNWEREEQSFMKVLWVKESCSSPLLLSNTGSVYY